MLWRRSEAAEWCCAAADEEEEGGKWARAWAKGMAISASSTRARGPKRQWMERGGCEAGEEEERGK
jgi:hypothetical protein